MQDT